MSAPRPPGRRRWTYAERREATLQRWGMTPSQLTRLRRDLKAAGLSSKDASAAARAVAQGRMTVSDVRSRARQREAGVDYETGRQRYYAATPEERAIRTPEGYTIVNPLYWYHNTT